MIMGRKVKRELSLDFDDRSNFNTYSNVAAISKELNKFVEQYNVTNQSFVIIVFSLKKTNKRLNH